MKKVLLLLSVFTLIFVTGCEDTAKEDVKENKDTSDVEEPVSFETYIEDNYDVDSDNVYVYATTDEFNDLIDNEETFFVFVGLHTWPACQAALPYGNEIAKEVELDEIIYFNARQDDASQVLDKYEVSTVPTLLYFEEGKLIDASNKEEYQNLAGETEEEYYTELFTRFYSNKKD